MQAFGWIFIVIGGLGVVIFGLLATFLVVKWWQGLIAMLFFVFLIVIGFLMFKQGKYSTEKTTRRLY